MGVLEGPVMKKQIPKESVFIADFTGRHGAQITAPRHASLPGPKLRPLVMIDR